MNSCFSGCTNLKTVTLKCDYNPAEILEAQAFKNTFKGCTALIDGGIKVPAGQLSTYQTNAATMGTTREKFAAE